MMTTLCFGQGKRDDAGTDADDDAADQSTTYMSPFHATQKLLQNTKQYILYQLVILYFKRVNLFNQFTLNTLLLII